jgi:excinuclease UvrABC ATPase subunit
VPAAQCQRLELAGRLHEEGHVYVLDEPITGLHLSDCGHLPELLDRLVDGGSSVIVVEHNLDSSRTRTTSSTWGRTAATRVDRLPGTPAELLSAGTHTGEHLARHVGATMSR